VALTKNVHDEKGIELKKKSPQKGEAEFGIFSCNLTVQTLRFCGNLRFNSHLAVMWRQFNVSVMQAKRGRQDVVPDSHAPKSHFLQTAQA
jgi:hypothetical protein